MHTEIESSPPAGPTVGPSAAVALVRPRTAGDYRGWRFAAPESITFVAPCPACGNECDWEEQRLDTRLRATVHCACA